MEVGQGTHNFMSSLLDEKPNPALSTVRTQAHNADRMATFPDAQLWAQGVWQQDKTTIKQDKLKVRSTPGTGSSW